MTTTRTHTQRGFAVILAVVVITAGVAAPAMAASNDDEEDSSIKDKVSSLFGKSATIAEATNSVLGGIWNNVGYMIDRVGDHDPERTPSECASDLQTEFNEHSASYLDYVNERVSASNSTDVIEVRCRYETDGTINTSSVYFVADIADGGYENASVVTSTNRTVDETIVLTGKATEEMPDEFVDFRTEFVETNTTPPNSYKPGIASSYAGYVHGTPEFIPSIDKLESPDGGDS